MIKMLHSTWAMVVLLMLVISVINAIISLTSGKPFKEKDLRIPLFTLIVAHIQLILGLITVFSSAQFHHLKEIGMGAAMKDSDIRMIVIEHPIIMIVSIIIITIGFKKLKNKSTDKEMFKTIAVYYGIGLLLVLSRIPWGQWFN
jgi:heme A synthase